MSVVTGIARRIKWISSSFWELLYMYAAIIKSSRAISFHICVNLIKQYNWLKSKKILFTTNGNSTENLQHQRDNRYIIYNNTRSTLPTTHFLIVWVQVS